jgi:hypothetical protein
LGGILKLTKYYSIMFLRIKFTLGFPSILQILNSNHPK